MKPLHIYIFLFFFVLIDVGLSIKYLKQKKELEIALRTNEVSKQELLRILLSEMEISFLTHNQHFNNKTKLYKPNGEFVQLEQLIDGEYIMAMVISQNTCSVCIMSALDELHRYLHNNPNKKGIILIPINNDRTFNHLYSTINTNVQIFRIDTDSADYLADRELPLFFMLSDNATISNPIIFYKELPQIFESYIKKVNELLKSTL